jgi:Zn-dependent protease with chaperone function
MEWFDWLKFASLLNIVLFLLFVQRTLHKQAGAAELAKALRFAPGHIFLKVWWGSFLLCLSYRLGASATVSPEAVLYGILPTLLAAILLIEHCDSVARTFKAERDQRAKEAARSARAAQRAAIKNRPEEHPLAGQDVSDEGPVLQ